MSSKSRNQNPSGEGHSKNHESLKQETALMRSSRADRSGPFKMVDSILPRWLGTLPISQARTIVDAHAEEGFCDERETQHRQQLLYMREAREEMSKRTLEVTSSISEAESKLKSRRSRFTLSSLWRASHKTERQLEELRQKESELNRQWKASDDDLTNLDRTAKELAETLFDENVHQQFRWTAYLLSQAKYNSLEPTLQSIDGLRESLSAAYMTYIVKSWELKADIRRSLRDLVHYQGERYKQTEDPSKDVPLSNLLRYCTLHPWIRREYHSVKLDFGSLTSSRGLYEDVQHSIYDVPLSNKGVVKELREKGFDERVHPIVTTKGEAGSQKGILRNGSRHTESGNRTVSFSDEFAVRTLSSTRSRPTFCRPVSRF
ncbi:hypothetical protein I302_100055 [Kwoniella bestiolae CBS 10118]|uniref:Uncharacterized protein n=1 Tax=Kwoniella bestiolae CBS 10118 TaxID=1296100 RepID=A0A1B9G3Z7_9TREE|nr:hypothetical protein I302_03427 [Kwoniella bestiolae CBS 10118]OCF25754.1 hypothetical protein I302_03427 [Kwoniella bestiolae CBS 10118]